MFQLLLKQPLDLFHLLVVILLNFTHRFPILVLLDDFLLLEVMVSLLQVLDVFIFLSARSFLLLAVTLLVLMKLGLYTALASIELSLEFLLFFEPLFHLGFSYKHDAC